MGRFASLLLLFCLVAAGRESDYSFWWNKDGRKLRDRPTEKLHSYPTTMVYNKLEMAPYKNLTTLKDRTYERRFYPSVKWVSTKYQCTGMNSCGVDPFMRLFRYIGGANAKGIHVPMTVPVLIEVEENKLAEGDSKTYEMSFYVPRKFQDRPPKPQDPLVTIKQRTDMEVYVRTYDGYSTNRIFEKQHQVLERMLVDDNIAFTDGLIFAGYDAPFHFLFRRNEVWMVAHEK